MQDGRVVGIALADLDSLQDVALEGESAVGGQDLDAGDVGVLGRDLAGEEVLPEGDEERGFDLLLDVGEGVGGGEGGQAWEAGLEDRDAEEVVAVAVGDVDVG
jgi:hypothetical protein